MEVCCKLFRACVHMHYFIIICITQNFNSITDLGRIASQFYIKYDTVEIFNEFLKSVMNEGDILAVISQSTEFAQLKVGKTWNALVTQLMFLWKNTVPSVILSFVILLDHTAYTCHIHIPSWSYNSYVRQAFSNGFICVLFPQVRDEEMNELDDLHQQCEVVAMGGAEHVHGKVNILLQSHISRIRVDSFSLVSDINYITDVSVSFFIWLYLIFNRYLFTLGIYCHIWWYFHVTFAWPLLNIAIKEFCR